MRFNIPNLRENYLKFTAAWVLLLFASPPAMAGDSPLFKFGEWGIGTINNHYMLYLGEGRFLITPIPEICSRHIPLLSGAALFAVLVFGGIKWQRMKWKSHEC